MRRRAFLGGVALLPFAAARAQGLRAARVGLLVNGHTTTLAAFRAGMRDLGYTEGVSLVLEERDADGVPQRLPGLAGELARQGVDLIVAIGSSVAVAAREAGVAVPVVFIAGDPVGLGLAASLSRPGGNATGVAMAPPDYAVKWFELLREIVPSARRIALLQNSVRGTSNQLPAIERAAQAPGIGLLALFADGPEEIERAFDKAREERADGIIVGSSSRFHGQRERVVAAAARARLPAVYEHREFPEIGGLASYGRDVRAAYRLLAMYVDRILKGAKPGDLPIEEPSKLELVVNLRTARALGLDIPVSVLARTDEVIE